MGQKSESVKEPAEQFVKGIRRARVWIKVRRLVIVTLNV